MLHRRLFGKSCLVLLVGLPLLWAAFPGQGPGEAVRALGVCPVRDARSEDGTEGKAVQTPPRGNDQGSRRRDRRNRKVAQGSQDRTSKRFEAPKNPKEYYKAYKDFPHLRHAIVELQEAKKEIEREEEGRFVRAVKAIDVAIAHVEEALKE